MASRADETRDRKRGGELAAPRVRVLVWVPCQERCHPSVVQLPHVLGLLGRRSTHGVVMFVVWDTTSERARLSYSNFLSDARTFRSRLKTTFFEQFSQSKHAAVDSLG